MRRTWNFTKTNPNTGGGVDLAFNWNVADLTSPIATSALYNFEGGQWREVAGAPAVTASTLTFAGYTGALSPFAIADISLTLPMTWINFSAKKITPGVMLDWTTANEVNVTLYEVEHSVNGSIWGKIGTVAAAGSRGSHQYSFAHAKPSGGVNFYRILQRDADGRFSYSKVVSVTFDAQKKKIQLYPNPVTGETLNVVAVEQVPVRIVNSAGGTVMQLILQTGNNQVNAKSFGKGMYVLIAGSERIPFVVQ
ncbi:MAG: T9SS type A sorting domain-containing protein [Sphingobacteriales bacterium]|nr:MAG: T9SS type A sorting domain-containing protein [Sphingobacteriales bacterium]